MKYTIAIGLLAVASASSIFADTNNVASVNAALAKLNAAANYSWTTTIQLPNASFTPSPVNGVTEKSGYSLETQDFNGDSYQVVFKGEKAAVKGQDDWESMDGASDQTAMIGGWLVNSGTPADEAAKLLKDADTLTNGDGGVISGALTAAGATDMMTFPARNGNKPTPPKDAKGSVKYWLNADGTLAKFESHLDAKVVFGGGDDQQPQDFEVIRTVAIHDVGTTKVSIPDGATKAIEGKAAASQ